MFRLFGRTIRLEPATGSRKDAGSGPPRERREFPREGREYRPREPREPQDPSGGFREFSTLRPAVAGFIAARRPVQLNQVNALVGRRMFGLAASAVLRRRIA
jgi:hypothetical protein